jgi:hypothetical protein
MGIKDIMAIRFQKLSPAEITKNHPSYYREDIVCFLILKGGTPAGLYGLIDRGVEPVTKARQAEAFLTIFPAFRHRILGKSFFLNLFDHAFSSGFQKIYTWTRLTSWQKLLDRFEPLGIQRLDVPPPWDSDPRDAGRTKVWFAKDNKRQSQKEN